MMRRSAQLFEIHRQIHQVRHKIAKIHAQRRRLAALYLEFNRLAVDKLALDAVQQPRSSPNELSTHAFRVISGRIQAAARYFEPHNMPLLVPEALEIAEEVGKDSTRTSTKSSGLAASTSYEMSTSSKQSRMPRIPSTTSWYHPLTLSRASAQKKLDYLKDELVLLQADYEGLSLCVQRFCDDNIALQSEVSIQRRNINQHPQLTTSVPDTLWRRLANVDLYNGATVNLPISSNGSMPRRNSTTSSRRMSFTSTANPNTERFTDFKNNWESCSIYERRRQSGTALPDVNEPLYPINGNGSTAEYAPPPRSTSAPRSLAHVNLTNFNYPFPRPPSIRMIG